MTINTPTPFHRLGFTEPMLQAVLTCAKCGKLSIPFPCEHCGSTEFVKSQTRRVIRDLPSDWIEGKRPASYGPADFAFYDFGDPVGTYPTLYRCPHGAPGARLGLTETYRIIEANAGVVVCEYKLDGAQTMIGLTDAEAVKFYARKKPLAWTPGRFMYNSLVRLFAENTRVRVERVQDISEEDALADGGWTYAACPAHKAPVLSFHLLWDSLHANPKPRYRTINGRKTIDHYVSHPWDGEAETREHRGKPWIITPNPHVWPIDFKRITAENPNG